MIKVTKLYIFLSLVIFSLFYLIGTKISPVTYVSATSSNCGYSCPVVHWTWTTKETDVEGHYIYTDKVSEVDCEGHYSCDSFPGYHLEGNKCKKHNSSDKNAVWISTTYKTVCPAGYQNNPSHSNCRQWVDTTYKYTNHSADVAYNKSDDPTKCHRPSDDTLRDTYQMDQGTREDFKHDNHEWKNSSPINCLPVDCVWHWGQCSVSCGGGTKDVIIDSQPSNGGKSCPIESERCNPQSCEEFPPKENCPTACGYAGGEVNDGLGGKTQCAATAACETGEVTGSPTPVPTSAPSDNNNNNNNNSSSDSHDAPVCNDQDPGSPGNLRATALGGGKVKLTWDNSPGPHTSYAVAYGPSIGNYLYGDPNVGNVTSYTVLALNPGGNYCFYVQAQNGCRGGSPSNVVCTNQPGTVRVLGATDNFNPLVEGIKDSFGGSVLGDSTELMATAEVAYSQDKLPSGNTQTSDTISIPALNVNESIYLPQHIGDLLTVGHHEVLSTLENSTQVYYGHNATDVFGSLYKINIGNLIVINKNGQNLNYQVTKKDFVSKYNVDSIKTANQNDIVLVTCSYTQPDFRILVKASLIK